MPSGFDPRQARWDQVEVPPCLGTRPSVVRTRLPESLTDAPLDALLKDITAGLTERFPRVMPIDVRADPPETPRGSVRLLHAALDPDGEGVAIETLLLRGGEVTCWVAPATRYAAERATARRAMAGRPALPAAETTRAADAARGADATPVAETTRGADATPAAGVPVAEARLTVTGQGDWLVARRGTGSRAIPASPATPPDTVELPASLLPMWLASVTGTGPRPYPGDHPMVITSRTALDALLDLTGPDASAVRTALAAPDLADEEVAELGTLASCLIRRWSLKWIAGRDDASGEDSSPRLESRGHLEILDAGPSAGLWRVLTDLPEVLTAGITDERPIGLSRTTPADVWHEVTLPLTA